MAHFAEPTQSDHTAGCADIPREYGCGQFGRMNVKTAVDSINGVHRRTDYYFFCAAS